MMSLEDDDISQLSDSLGTEYFKDKEILAEHGEYYAEFTDVLCKKCDCGLHIIQLNNDDSIIKIICSKCGSEQELGLCVGCNDISNNKGDNNGLG